VSYQLTVERVFEASAEAVFEASAEAVFEASAEAVFEAFTSADAQRVWMRDPDDPNAIVESECDPRVGGRWVTAWGPAGTSCTARPTCSRWSTDLAGSSCPRRPRRPTASRSTRARR
jgi:Activator of Hsp90 ATPase homolog 1-like protein